MAARRNPPVDERNPPPPAAAPAPDEQQTEYNPFLKPADLRNGAEFQLTGWVREANGRFGPQIIIEVTQKQTGEVFDFAMKVGSANHRQMFARCGADIRKWQGAITLTVRAGTYGDFVAIEKIPF